MRLFLVILLLSLGCMTLAESNVTPLSVFIRDLVNKTGPHFSSRINIEGKDDPQALINNITNKIQDSLKTPNQNSNDKDVAQMLHETYSTETPEDVNEITTKDFSTNDPFDEDLEEVTTKETSLDGNINFIDENSIKGQVSNTKDNYYADEETSSWLQSIMTPELPSEDNSNKANVADFLQKLNSRSPALDDIITNYNNNDANLADYLKELNSRSAGIDDKITTDNSNDADVAEYLQELNSRSAGIDDEITNYAALLPPRNLAGSQV